MVNQVGRIRLANAASVAALIAVGAIALSACSSSGGGGGSTTTPTTSAPAATSPADTGTDSGTSTTTGSGGIKCSSGKLNAAGSTAQANAMDAWRKAYQQACPGATINYNPTGSGDGITALETKTIDFAGSDAALDPKEDTPKVARACGSTPWNLPMVVGPIAIVFKVGNIQNLVLNGPTLAKIFLGKITTWNDPAIKQLNPKVNLPSAKINVFFRSDSSGTTQNFETYLSQTAPSIFTATPDKDASAAHIVGQGENGSSGIAAAMAKTDDSISYVEFSYAVQASLPTAAIDNGGGPVQLSKDTASKAAGVAKVTGQNGDLTLSLDYAQKTPGAYPLILVTYEIVCSKYKNPATAAFVKNFLNYTVNQGQGSLAQLGYAPLPTALQTKVKLSISKIH